MKNISIFVFVTFFSLSFSANAVTEEVTNNTEFKTFKAQTELRFETLKEFEQQDLDKFKQQSEFNYKTIDAFDKRISDINYSIQFYSILITVLVFIATIVTYFSASTKAKDEARQSAEIWFKDNEKDLLNKLDKLTKLVEKQASDAIQSIKQDSHKVHEAKQIVMDMQKSFNKGDADNNISSHDANELKEIATDIKQKPESEYTFKDWNTLAFAAVSAGNFETSVDYWDKFLLANESNAINIATALFNKSVAFLHLKKPLDAINSFDEIIDRYKNSLNPEVQQQVAMALVNKGAALEQLKEPEEAILCYENVVQLFELSKLTILEPSIAAALFNKANLLSARNTEHDAEEALSICDRLIKRFENSETLWIVENVNKAYFNKIITLAVHKKDLSGAKKLYEKLISRVNPFKVDETYLSIKQALLNKLMLLNEQANPSEVVLSHLKLCQQLGLN